MIKVEDRIREIIPAAELRTVNHTIGVPGSLNLAFVPSDNVSGADGEMLISLNKPHRPSADYRQQLRERLEYDFPGVTFYFQTADIVSQVLNFGLPAPIDIQIQDQNFTRSYEVGQRLLQMVRRIPGVVDPRITQMLDFPTLQIDVDRQRAARLGVAQRDVANNMLASLSGSSLISPTYYPQSAERRELHRRGGDAGRRLQIGRRHPELPGQSADQQHQSGHRSRPLPTTLPSAPVTRLSDIASVRPGSTMNSINHYTIQRVIDVAANVEGRDLGSVAAEINKAIAEVQKDSAVDHQDLRCAARTRSWRTRSACSGFGLILAIILVYAVLVVLFQSWVDPFIIMMAVPGALARHPLDAGAHRHHDQRDVADGRHHGGRHLGVELDPGGELRQRSALAQ